MEDLQQSSSVYLAKLITINTVRRLTDVSAKMLRAGRIHKWGTRLVSAWAIMGIGAIIVQTLGGISKGRRALSPVVHTAS